MIKKEYKAGKFTSWAIFCFSVIVLLAVIIMYSRREWSIAFIPPLLMACIGFIKFYKFTTKPQFKISEGVINIFNPAKKIEIEKIISVKSEGKDKLELILKNDLPVPLFLRDLSKKDRKDLELTIKQMIGQKS